MQINPAPDYNNGNAQRSDAPSAGERAVVLGRLGRLTVPAGMSRKTVKELIMMKRQAMQQSEPQGFQQNGNPPQKKPLRARRADFVPISPAVHQDLAAIQPTPAPSSTTPPPPPPAMADAMSLFSPGPIYGHVSLPQQHVQCPAAPAPTDSLSPLAVDLSKQAQCSVSSSALSPFAVDLSRQAQCTAPISAVSPFSLDLSTQEAQCSGSTIVLSPLEIDLSIQQAQCSGSTSVLSPLAIDLSIQQAQCSGSTSVLSPLAIDLSIQQAQCSGSTSVLCPLAVDLSIPQAQYSASTLSPFAVDLSKQPVKCSASSTDALPSFIDVQSEQHVPWSAPSATSALQQTSPLLAEGKMTFFQWQILQELQKLEGTDPEILMAQDDDGDTFLHIAVAQGKRALAHVLAGKMAAAGFLDMRENKGQTALQLAAATNQHLIVQDLLVHGAQLDTTDCWGRSPLHVCAEKGHLLSLQIIHRFLNGSWQPIDVEQVNYDGLTPLHTAVLRHNAVDKELRCLPSAPSSRWAEELSLRSRMYGGCVRTLLLMGACCGTTDLKSGRTSLHMASEEANMDLLHIFLEQPSSLSIINIKMYNGNTALHIASSLQNRSSQVEAIRLLLRRGADPSLKNNENELPAHLVPAGPVGDKLRQILKGKAVHS